MLDREQKLLLPGEWEKLTAIENSKQFMLPLGANWIEHDVLNITKTIMERWPELRIASCDCGWCHRRGHFPHMVMEIRQDGSMVPVFGFSEFSGEIIQHLEAIDSRMEGGAKELAKKRIAQMEKHRIDRKAREKDERGDLLDMAESALRSHKHDYSTPIGKCSPNGNR